MRLLPCAAVLFLAAFAAAPVPAGEIVEVSVEGLGRTRPHIAETPLLRFVGMSADEIDFDEVMAAIRNLGVLEPLAVEIVDRDEGDGRTLVVTVRERWSVLGAPFFAISDGGWFAGAGVADINAFGRRHMMVLAGAYGLREWFLMSTFIATPNTVGDFGGHFIGNFSLATVEHTDQTGETPLRRFDTMRIGLGLGVSYRIAEGITPSLRLSYTHVELRDGRYPLDAPTEGTRALGVAPGIELRRSGWDGFLISEDIVSLEYHHRFVLGGDDVRGLSLRAAYNMAIAPGFRAVARGGLALTNQAATPFFEQGPLPGINILSSGYSTRNQAGLSLGLERHLFRFPLGAVSVAAAYQAVYSDGSILRNQFDHGPVATLQIYFSRLAFPGIGMGAAYNVGRNAFLFALNVGMMF